MAKEGAQMMFGENIIMNARTKLIKCPVCGKEFESNANHRKYCSTKCSRIAQARKNIKHISKRTNDIGKVRAVLQEVYAGKCAVCGWGIPSKYNLQASGCDVHHIVEACNGGDESETNVILLCPNCHRLAHRGELGADELRKYLLPWDEAPRERWIGSMPSHMVSELNERLIFGSKEPVTREVTLCMQCKYGRRLTEEEAKMFIDGQNNPEFFRICENMRQFNGHGCVFIGDYCSFAKYDLIRKARLGDGRTVLDYSEVAEQC